MNGFKTLKEGRKSPLRLSKGPKASKRSISLLPEFYIAQPPGCAIIPGGLSAPPCYFLFPFPHMLKTAVSNPVSRTLFEAGRRHWPPPCSPCGAGRRADRPAAELPRTQLSAGIHIIRAEVANTEESRRSGLMFRRERPATTACCSCSRTPTCSASGCAIRLPLSIAFITDDGTIVNIEDMAPQTEDPHCSKAVRYALEMAQLVRAARHPGRPQDRRIAVGVSPPRSAARFPSGRAVDRRAGHP